MRAEISVDVIPAPARGEVICGVEEADCLCLLGERHDGPHRCECGGEWDWHGTEFHIVKLPGIFGGF